MRLVLIGDGESPHLEKWVRGLLGCAGVELWCASSRGFTPGILALLPDERRFALNTRPDVAGGNAALLRHLPRLARWLRGIRPDWLHAHYLSSHGTLAWLAQTLFGVGGRLVGSAWGSDILVTPAKSRLMRVVTSRVLRHCALATSDSLVMAERMRELGAGEVMVFPFGLESLPPRGATKEPWLFFANRALEPLYAPERVLEAFAAVAREEPSARLVVANEGSLRVELEAACPRLDIAGRVRFTGRLDAAAQAGHYAGSSWYLSLPRSDSISVSLLEAMAHGCIPIVSELPANRELVRHGENGLVLGDDALLTPAALRSLAARAAAIAADNRRWIEANALFGPCVQRFGQRLRELS
jgi:L-malate glycosyltransferase